MPSPTLPRNIMNCEIIIYLSYCHTPCSLSPKGGSTPQARVRLSVVGRSDTHQFEVRVFSKVKKKGKRKGGWPGNRKHTKSLSNSRDRRMGIHCAGFASQKPLDFPFFIIYSTFPTTKPTSPLLQHGGVLRKYFSNSDRCRLNKNVHDKICCMTRSEGTHTVHTNVVSERCGVSLTFPHWVPVESTRTPLWHGPQASEATE